MVSSKNGSMLAVFGIRHQQHVGRFDALPAGDGRAVEGVAGGELVFVEMRHRHGHVLFLAAGVGEAEVDELDFVLLHHLHHVCDGLGCHQVSPGWMWLLRNGRAGMQVLCQSWCMARSAEPGDCRRGCSACVPAAALAAADESAPSRCNSCCAPESVQSSLAHQFGAELDAQGLQARRAAARRPAPRRPGAPLTPRSMWRPYCGWSTLGRLNTFTPRVVALDLAPSAA